MITGTPNYYDGTVYFGISSLEEVFGGQAKYECCSFRGSVVALDASTGATVWKFTRSPKPPSPPLKPHPEFRSCGPSGAAAGRHQAVDLKRNAIIVATGDDYSDTPDRYQRRRPRTRSHFRRAALVAPMTANDAYNLACFAPDRSNCPDANGPDLDFGQPPILVSLPHGKDELVIGQKSGVAWAIDPDQQGKVLWQTRVGKGGVLGGSQWGSAIDGHSMFVSISDLGFLPVKDPAAAGKLQLDPATGGGLAALDLVSGSKIWSAPPASCGDRKNCSPAQPGAVSAIPGIAFLKLRNTMPGRADTAPGCAGLQFFRSPQEAGGALHILLPETRSSAATTASRGIELEWAAAGS